MIIDIEKGYDAFITAYPFDFCNRENWSNSTNWNLSNGTLGNNSFKSVFMVDIPRV